MINVIFDMDGTLINSSNAICSAVNEIRQDLNLKTLEHKFIMQTINTPGKDWAKILYNIDNFEHSTFKEGFEKYFIKHYKQSVILYDGVLKVLEFLKDKNCFIAIATNAPQSSLSKVLEKHNILPYFDKALGVSFDIEPKPSPMMLKRIQAEAKFNKTIFVGDSAKDKLAAQNANIPYIHAKWGEDKCEKDEFTNADELIKLIQDFINL